MDAILLVKLLNIGARPHEFSFKMNIYLKNLEDLEIFMDLRFLMLKLGLEPMTPHVHSILIGPI